MPPNASILRPSKTPNFDNPKSATLQYTSPSIRTLSNLRSLQIKDVYNMLVTAVFWVLHCSSISAKTIHYVITSFRVKNIDDYQTHPTLCNRYVPEGPLQVQTDYTNGQLFMSTQVSPDERPNDTQEKLIHVCTLHFLVCRLCKQKNYDYDLKYFGLML